VDHGVVQIDLSGLKSDYVAELPVSLVGKNDQVVENAQIKVDQPKVKAQVTITENMSSKSVQIRPAITGEIQESWLVSSVEVKPTTVRITGAFDLIKDIEYLTTDTIDLTLLEDSFSGKINLNIPEGVGVLDGTQVDVNIKLIKNLIKRTISGLPIEVRNAPANKNYGTLPTQVDVELQAFPWVFAGRSTTEGGYDIPVKPFVDLGGEPANSKDYEIQIECPPEFEVLTISTKTVRVHQ
jgi:YbbR domain-containing protein